MALSYRQIRRKKKKKNHCHHYGELGEEEEEEEEKKQRCTHHNGDEMPVVVRKWSVTPQDEMLGAEKMLQVRGMRGHHPGDMIQPVVLEERIHQQDMSL